MTKPTEVNIDQYDCMEDSRTPQDTEEDLLCVTVLGTVERGPLPSTPGPCYRKAPAAELVTDDRTQRQGSRQSAAHRSAAEGWSPIGSAPQTR